MKKLLVFVILLLVMISPSFAFSFNDLVGMVTGMNDEPEVNLNTPSNNHIYPTDTPLFSWSYTDSEGDKQVAYLIHIDDDYQFSNPMQIGGTDDTTEKRVKLRRGEGQYWARVKVKDRYQWSDWSNIRNFYIDLSPKRCNDGTEFWKCSSNVPFYCDVGLLIEDCSLCGCPINSLCQPSGRCLRLTCRDGTGYSECSKDRPYYCQAGNLIEICSLCGCPKGQECNADGSCSAIVLVTPQEEFKPEFRPLSILERIALFFKGLFGRWT